MRHIALILCFWLAIVLSSHAKIIASCGPLAGYSYFYEDDLHDSEGWEEAKITGTTIFTRSGDDLDVIIQSSVGDENWTRSASDEGAPIAVVNAPGEVLHIIVIWDFATELYALDLKRKTFSLISHKAGIIDVTHALVGPCE